MLAWLLQMFKQHEHEIASFGFPPVCCLSIEKLYYNKNLRVSGGTRPPFLRSLFFFLSAAMTTLQLYLNLFLEKRRGVNFGLDRHRNYTLFYKPTKYSYTITCVILQ